MKRIVLLLMALGCHKEPVCTESQSFIRKDSRIYYSEGDYSDFLRCVHSRSVKECTSIQMRDGELGIAIEDMPLNGYENVGNGLVKVDNGPHGGDPELELYVETGSLKTVCKNYR